MKKQRKWKKKQQLQLPLSVFQRVPQALMQPACLLSQSLSTVNPTRTLLCLGRSRPRQQHPPRCASSTASSASSLLFRRSLCSLLLGTRTCLACHRPLHSRRHRARLCLCLSRPCLLQCDCILPVNDIFRAAQSCPVLFCCFAVSCPIR